MEAARHFCNLVEQNRLTEAKRFLAQTDEDVSEDPRVRRARAVMAWREGDPDEAIDIYRSLVDAHADPADAEALGGLLLRTGRFDEAAAAYRGWTRRWPERREFQGGYADSLESAGDKEAAKAVLRRIVDREPGAGRAWYRLSMMGDYDWIHERRRQLLAEDDGTGDLADRCAREFAAARYLETRGEWDEAFRRLQQANELRRTVGTLNIRKRISAAVTVMRDWTAQDWDAAAPGHPSGAPIFIVGMPRSGTSLLEQILDSHPEVEGIGERPYMQQEIARTLRESRLPVARLDWAAAGERYLERVREVAGEVGRFADKMFFNFNTVGFIRRIFPNAHIVYCRRNPLDTCIACFRTDFNSLELSYDLRELGWFYGYCEGMMTFWRQQFGGSITEVRYEDLVAEPRERIAELLESLGLPWSEQCLKFHENPRVLRTASIYQIRRPVYTDAVGRARHYRHHLRPLEEAIEEARGWMRPPAQA